MMNDKFCKAAGIVLKAAVVGPNGVTGEVEETRGGMFERPADGVSMESLDAANRTLTGVVNEMAQPKPTSPNRRETPPQAKYDAGPFPEDVLRDGIWAAGTMDDMVGGAIVLNSVIKSVKEQKEKNKDIHPDDIPVGDREYIPEGEMSIPDLALRPGAKAYDVVKSSKMFIGKHPPPSIAVDAGYNFGPTEEISLNTREEEMQRIIGGMNFIVPEEMQADANKQGYWSMRLPSLRAGPLDKAMTALRMMVGNNPLSCAYIDSPDVLLRFDFRRRDFSGVRVHRSHDESQALWRGVCSSARAERLRELERMTPGTKPLYAEDIIQMTKDDGDALICAPKEYQEPIPVPLVEEYIKVLKGLLIRRFVYSGLSIFVKHSRNDLLMSHNCTEEEVRARELLCEMIGFKEYCNYLRRGFIVAQGRSGQRYVIKGGHSLIEVYGKGADGVWLHVEDLCIQFKDYQLTHTDSVIMRKLFVEHDEFALRKKSNTTKRNLGLEEAKTKRRHEQRNPMRETSRDELLTWERSQDPAQLQRDRQDLAAQLGAAFRQTQEQRVG